MKFSRTGSLLLLIVVCSLTAFAGPFITIDENGHGTIDWGNGLVWTMPWVLEPDPSWSSPFNVLAYSMMGPPSVVAGDVQMRDGSVTLDVIRFNPAGTGGNPLYPASILFYSDNLDGFDALADTPGPPPQHTNVVYIDEVGTESVNYGLYTPSNGQPGFVPGYTVSYKFISDTPEPGSVLLLASGVAFLFAFRRWKR